MEYEYGTRFPIPPEHEVITHKKCDYYLFILNDNFLIECIECSMRNYCKDMKYIYHFKSCSHWTLNLHDNTNHIFYNINIHLHNTSKLSHFCNLMSSIIN